MFRAVTLGVALPLLLAGPARSTEGARPIEGAQPQGLLSSLLRGTEEDQAACRPDVVRLCQPAIPDTFRVLYCLKQQRAQLSKPCLSVLQNHGQ